MDNTAVTQNNDPLEPVTTMQEFDIEEDNLKDHLNRFSYFVSRIKACVRYFLSNFCFSPNESPLKTIENILISSEKLFTFSRYSKFCICVFPSFFPVSHCLRG